jgi:ribosomal protein L11 methyltransferase
MSDEYRRFWVTSRDAIERECLLAEAFDAGAEGAEEVEEEGGFRACIYAGADRIEKIHDLILDSFSAETLVGPVEAMPEVDWSEAWKAGLEAISISKRLLIRPPFVEADLEPGQREIVIDPGQAFGIGGHASTRLCLEWIDELLGSSASSEHVQSGPENLDRVLDVGTGSGVLALAAIALGARRAIGFDLDPVATIAAREAAIQNQLSASAHFFTGPIEALRSSEPTFPLVLANLLKQEMLPIATEIARLTSRDGRLVLAGLLEEDVGEVKDRFAREGLLEVGRRSLRDATGEWIGLCLSYAD